MQGRVCLYPERRKGSALGLNAAGGNLGVAVVQVVVPAVIGTWWFYLRRILVARIPSLAFAQV